MREILFRGKSSENGEWIYGSLIKRSMGSFIVDEANKCSLQYCGEYDFHFNSKLVKPETIGQYTGLTDKNGKKIFEGDIVKITDTNVDLETFAFIEFGNPNGLYNWGWQLVPLKKIPFAVEILHWVEMEETGAFIEVIGNIHDNLEPLKGDG